MWVARDKNNELFLSITKPIRNLHDNVWKVSNTSDCTDWMLLDETLFPELKLKDEPIEVKLEIANPTDSWRYYGGDDSFMGK